MVGWWLLKKTISNEVSNYMATLKVIPMKVFNDVPVVEVLYNIENYFMRVLKQWRIEMFTAFPCPSVLDCLLLIASLLRFALA